MRGTQDTELWVRVHAPGPGISFPPVSWARICRGRGGSGAWRILHRTCVGPQSCFAGTLGAGLRAVLGFGASRGFERHVATVTDTDYRAPFSEWRSRSPWRSKSQRQGRLETETLLRLYSWLWAFRGASDLLPRTAIERHASRKKSSTSQPKTWLPSSRSIDGPDARIKARIIF